MRSRTASQSSVTAPPRRPSSARPRPTPPSAKAPLRAGRDEVRADVAERDEPAAFLERDEAAEPAPGNVLEEDALDRILRAEGEDILERRAASRAGTRDDGAPPARSVVGCAPVPIHVRAEPGDYAEACLLPGDPLRAKYIAETFLEDAAQGTRERGMLGYTGTFRGKPVSVQSTGMGCPSAAIVIEELIQLGVKRLLRVGTCGGLQPDLQLGDLIVAISAVPPDATALALHRRRAARADGRLGAHPRGRPRGQGARQAGAGRADRLERRLLQPRRRASTSAGPTAASSPSRWRPPCSSRSARSARCRRAAC